MASCRSVPSIVPELLPQQQDWFATVFVGAGVQVNWGLVGVWVKVGVCVGV